MLAVVGPGVAAGVDDALADGAAAAAAAGVASVVEVVHHDDQLAALGPEDLVGGGAWRRFGRGDDGGKGRARRGDGADPGRLRVTGDIRGHVGYGCQAEFGR